MRAIAIALLALAPAPAYAANTPEDLWFMYLTRLLPLCAVIGAGLGYVLGRLLPPGLAILVFTVVAMAPTLLLLIDRGIDRAAEFASMQFMLLIMLVPFAYLGWRVSRAQSTRTKERST